MGRTPCCEKVGLQKGPWSADEDLKLLSYIQKHGHGSWRHLPPKAGLQRCGKSCRLRWTNYLRPDIKRGNFSLQEEQTIIQLHALLGNRWSTIANHLPRRTDNEIKNYWNTHLKKRLTKMGIDPMTHKPKANVLIIGSSDDQSKDISNLNHMAQWEIARLEAEARLVREAKFVIPNPINSLSKDSLLALPPLNKQQPMVPPCLDILKASERSSWADINLNFNVGTLLSPNSVLMPPFPDNMNFITAAASVSASVSPRLDNYAQKGNEVEGTIEMQEIMGSFSDQVDFGDQSFSLGIPNSRLMEFPDEFLLSDNCCGGGYLEDNKYWN